MNPLATILAPYRLLVGSVFLALGQIWANKLRAFLTAIGIVIGVASVTAVVAALAGLRRNVLTDLETFGTNKIYVTPQRPESGTGRHAPWSAIVMRPEHFEGLLGSCPAVGSFTRFGGGRSQVLRFRDRSVTADMRGIEPAWHAIENRSVILGRPFAWIDNQEARHVCLITPDLRDSLHLDRDCVGQRVHLGRRSFVVVGVVEPTAELSVLDLGSRRYEVFIPFQTLWESYRGWMIGIATSQSPELSEEAQSELRLFLRRTRGISPNEPDNFRVQPIQQYLDRFNRISNMVTLIAAGVVGISLLVGGVGIMNIMLVSVSERTREIGLRKALGARDSAILMQFLVEAVTLCLLGGVAGVLVGQGLTWSMAQIPRAKLEHAHIPLWAIAVAFGFCAVVGVVFGMFPAMKAARLDPIEALRHE